MLRTGTGAESLVAEMQSHLQTSGSRFSLMQSTSTSLTLIDKYLEDRPEWFPNRAIDGEDVGTYSVESLMRLLEMKYGFAPHSADYIRKQFGSNQKVVIKAGDKVRDAAYRLLDLTKEPGFKNYQLQPVSRKGTPDRPVELDDIGGWQVLSL